MPFSTPFTLSASFLFVKKVLSHQKCTFTTYILHDTTNHYIFQNKHWRHCNPGHRAMGRVVFLPRPEIIYINTPFSLPRPEVIYIWAWLISAPNGVSDDKQCSNRNKFSIIMTGFAYSLNCDFEQSNLATFVYQNGDF